MSDFEREMEAGMQRMMHGMHVAYSGNADADFLAMMIPHHEGAVEAEDIIASQTVEISAMKGRLAILRGEKKNAEPGFPELGDTRGR